MECEFVVGSTTGNDIDIDGNLSDDELKNFYNDHPIGIPVRKYVPDL
jgi:hypothetical protein